jgi:hypothetical protein
MMTMEFFCLPKLSSLGVPKSFELIGSQRQLFNKAKDDSEDTFKKLLSSK